MCNDRLKEFVECPECGSTVCTSSGMVGTHTYNGFRAVTRVNEETGETEPFYYKVFNCGYKVEETCDYNKPDKPMCTTKVGDCKLSTKYKDEFAKKQKLCADLLSLIDDSDVDEEFKKFIWGTIEYAYYE